MSTPESFGVKAESPAERALFLALFDDAAVFPPGLTPLSRAVTDHVARQSRSYAGSAGLVGPLLLPAAAISDLLDLERQPSRGGLQGGLEVALVSRPDGDPKLVGAALSSLSEHPTVTVTGIEIGWSADWHNAPGWALESWDSPLSIEVPRGGELERALADLQTHAGDPYPVQAKFRTGSTPQLPAPTSTELATFIRAAVDRDLSFKLTGGLHHAISTTASSHASTKAGAETVREAETEAEDQLGFLNVIAATRYALAHGAEVPEMESLLREPDPVPILDIITRMSAADASVLRAFFTSYGCCGVLDPIRDLAALGLIEEETV